MRPTISFKRTHKFVLTFEELNSSLSEKANETAKKAIYIAAGIVADEVRANIEALPEEKFRRLKEDDIFSGISASQKQDLSIAFGLTPITEDINGFLYTKLGFKGFGRFPTKKYPKGVPNYLLAEAIEFGSSVREKCPFIGPAIRKTQEKAIEAMGKAYEEAIDDVMRAAWELKTGLTE